MLLQVILAAVTLSLPLKGAGWKSLFDGRSFAGWTLGDGSPVTSCWTIEDGAIATLPSSGFRSDLLSQTFVTGFELVFDFRLSPGANTGVKYFVSHVLRYLTPPTMLGAAGLEFQLIDDTSAVIHNPDQKTGALYGLLPPEQPVQLSPSGR
jgi:hypothetical protein